MTKKLKCYKTQNLTKFLKTKYDKTKKNQNVKKKNTKKSNCHKTYQFHIVQKNSELKM